MGNVISVITAIYKPEPRYLIEAYDSLHDQEMPSGWELEWVVQDDGPDGGARAILPSDDPVIAFGTARHGGVAITRNLALARARGNLIKNLDQDDGLTPGVLSRDIANMTEGIGWTTSRVLDLLPDGSTIGFSGDPEPGPIEPGFVLDHWKAHNYRLPVHPTSLCIRRSLLVAVGGWMASPGSDDTGMLVAASMQSTGYFESKVGLLYRKWPGQVTASPDHRQPEEWTLRMRLIEERGETLRDSVPALR